MPKRRTRLQQPPLPASPIRNSPISHANAGTTIRNPPLWFHSLGDTRDRSQLLADDLLTIARDCGEFAPELAQTTVTRLDCFPTGCQDVVARFASGGFIVPAQVNQKASYTGRNEETRILCGFI